MAKINYNGRDIIKQCECSPKIRNVEFGKGDHVKIYPSNSNYPMMVVPNRPLGKGLASKIAKWMVLIGIVLSAIVHYLA